ncbi:MAG: hypothetical protein ACRD6I_07555 [Candidatus Acidiferrales bacterium]
MTELILSDITRMAGGYCVIGLEPQGDGFRSVRPMPPSGHAWPQSFAYRRGDKLQFNFTAVEVTRPHVEDRLTGGVIGQAGRLSGEELLACMVQAEIAPRVSELFGCAVRPGKTGASIHAPKGRRSICGARAGRVRLKWEATQLRARVALASGDLLPDLPVVDRSWHRYVETLLGKMEGANRLQRLNRYLGERLQSMPELFVRIGLTRPHPPRWGRCQLMVDTLFPLPRKSWMGEFEASHV